MGCFCLEGSERAEPRARFPCLPARAATAFGCHIGLRIGLHSRSHSSLRLSGHSWLDHPVIAVCEQMLMLAYEAFIACLRNLYGARQGYERT